MGGVVASGATTLNYYVGGANAGPVNGVIVRMTGITPSEPTGAGWDLAIGVWVTLIYAFNTWKGLTARAT